MLPYFVQFENQKNLLEKLLRFTSEAFEVASAVEFALCFGDTGVVARFIGERPDLREAIEDSLQKLKLHGFPSLFPTAYADQIAWVRLAYDPG